MAQLNATLPWQLDRQCVRWLVFGLPGLKLSPSDAPYMCYRICIGHHIITNMVNAMTCDAAWSLAVVVFDGSPLAQTWFSPLMSSTAAEALADRDDDLLPYIASHPHLDIDIIMHDLEYISS
jgi:hypothetical protein